MSIRTLLGVPLYPLVIPFLLLCRCSRGTIAVSEKPTTALCYVDFGGGLLSRIGEALLTSTSIVGSTLLLPLLSYGAHCSRGTIAVSGKPTTVTLILEATC